MPAIPLNREERQQPATEHPVKIVQKQFDPEAVSRARQTLTQAKVTQAAPAPVNNRSKADEYTEWLGRAEAKDPFGTGRLDTSVAPTPQMKANDAVPSAEATLNDALRQQRVEAIGANEARPKKLKDRVDQMSQEDYDNLTDEQRAAVDFNTMLVRAVKQDRRSKDFYDPSHEQVQDYSKTYNDLFGANPEQGQLYAPETLAVLSQIDFKDKLSNLDDFLSLDSAIHADDLKGLLPTAHVREADGTEADRIGLSNEIVTGTQKLQQTLAAGQKLLQSFDVTADAARAPAVTLLGGTPEPAKHAAIGWGEAYTTNAQGQKELTQDGYFQRAFDSLADKSKDPKNTLADMNNLLDPQQLQEFLTYAHNRSTNAERFGVDLLHARGVKSRTPEEFRKLLGLAGGESDA